jgi:hypothetical protein
MHFHEFNRGAASLASMVLSRFERDKTLVFTVRPEGADPVHFAVWRPSNYTMVLTDHPNAFETWNEREERRVDGEWWRVCDHDSCWRDQWSYNIPALRGGFQVEVLSVALFAGEPMSTEAILDLSVDERWLRLLEGEPVWSSDLAVADSTTWQATLVDLLFQHWNVIGHDPEEASFEFEAIQQVGNRRRLQRVLHYKWEEGKPVFVGWSSKKGIVSGTGTGTVVGDLYRFVLSSWTQPPEVTFETLWTCCKNAPFGGWPH